MVELISALFLGIIPIAGIIWMGIRYERQQQERLLADSLRALSIIGISRGNRR